ncbi:hypothetical protein CAPTEDRAFT_226368, partial [Capitella teleta]
MNSLWVFVVALVGIVSCEDGAVVYEAGDDDSGVQVVVNYLTGQQNDYTTLTGRVQSLEAQVNRLKNNMASGASGQTVENGEDCGCPRGPTGPPGPAGPRGPSGPVGPPGVSGRTGATGYQGQDGRNGGTGATGRSGQSGQTGRTGRTGATGQRGSMGRTGATGASDP